MPETPEELAARIERELDALKANGIEPATVALGRKLAELVEITRRGKVEMIATMHRCYLFGFDRALGLVLADEPVRLVAGQVLVAFMGTMPACDFDPITLDSVKAGIADALDGNPRRSAPDSALYDSWEASIMAKHEGAAR